MTDSCQNTLRNTSAVLETGTHLSSALRLGLTPNRLSYISGNFKRAYDCPHYKSKFK